MMQDGRTTLKFIVIIIIIVGIAGYAAFQARKVIAGPVVEIQTPYDGAVIEDSTLEISGNARNIAFMYLNGRKIFTDDVGAFKEDILLFPGHNVIELKAEDKFGKTVERWIRIYRKI